MSWLIVWLVQVLSLELMLSCGQWKHCWQFVGMTTWLGQQWNNYFTLDLKYILHRTWDKYRFWYSCTGWWQRWRDVMWFVVASKRKSISCLVLTNFLSFLLTTSSAALSRTMKKTGSEYCVVLRFIRRVSSALSLALYVEWVLRCPWLYTSSEYCVVLGFIRRVSTLSHQSALEIRVKIRVRIRVALF